MEYLYIVVHHPKGDQEYENEWDKDELALKVLHSHRDVHDRIQEAMKSAGFFYIQTTKDQKVIGKAKIGFVKSIENLFKIDMKDWESIDYDYPGRSLGKAYYRAESCETESSLE